MLMPVLASRRGLCESHRHPLSSTESQMIVCGHVVMIAHRLIRAASVCMCTFFIWGGGGIASIPLEAEGQASPAPARGRGSNKANAPARGHGPRHRLALVAIPSISGKTSILFFSFFLFSRIFRVSLSIYCILYNCILYLYTVYYIIAFAIYVLYTI